MKAVLVLLLGLLFFAAALRTEQEYKNLFSEFVAKHKKQYQNGLEESYRFEMFKENQAYIDEHNAQADKTFTLGMNRFGDWSDEEFISKMLPSKGRTHTSRILESYKPAKNDTPAAWDWRDKGVVTQVKDQGDCGSCWAFGTVCSIETTSALKTGKLVSLSEQQLVDCDKTNDGCDGGFSSSAFEYVISNKGLDTEEYYPYTAGYFNNKKNDDNRCKYSTDHIGATIVKYINVTRGDEAALKVANYNLGAITVSIYADTKSFRYYKSGVLVEKNCKNGYFDLDHAVCLVGYGTENGQDYWLIKNSWGTSWGDSGFAKMARNHKNMCGIATDANVASN